MSFTVALDASRRLVIKTPYSPPLATILSRMPDRRLWDGQNKVWRATASRTNIEYLRKEIPQLVWNADALAHVSKVMTAGTPPVRATDVSDFPFRQDPPPYAHQLEGFALSRTAPAYALLMQQRTGKTRIGIEKGTDHFLKGQVNLGLVICPNTVKTVWEEQIPQWTPTTVATDVIVYEAAKKLLAAKRLKVRRPGHFQWLVVNCEIFQSKSTFEWLLEQVDGRDVFCLVDEASRFKNPKSERTKKLWKFRDKCKVREFLTGTLITQGPLDAYAPFYFLDPAILGYNSFYSFRNAHALLGGYGGKEVVGYVNVDKITEKIMPFSYRKLRSECADLPPKIYEKIMVDLADEQQKVYDQMRDEMLAEFGDVRVNAAIVLTQMLRLQQIVGGFLPDPNTAHLPPEDRLSVAIPGPNPKLDALLQQVEEIDGKIIIWARFRPEIALISRRLQEIYGSASVVEFHGGVKEPLRTQNRRAFQDAPQVRFIIGQPATGGLGIPLHAANDVFYFSNTFSLEERLQSEDRAQDLNKKVAVAYNDIFATNTIDTKRILPSLREKKHWADTVHGDRMEDWI